VREVAAVKRLEYRADIDGLRAVAVLCVLFFHLDFAAFSGGFVGFDVFFVISAFLITRLIFNEVKINQSFNFAHFYSRSIRRLAPALIVTLSSSWIFAFLLFSPEHFKRFGGALLSAMLSISNFFFWSESDYFDTAVEFKPLLHTWSLGVEEQFYLLWPALLVFLLFKGPKIVAPLFLLVGITLSLLLNVIFADGNSGLVASLPKAIGEWFSDGAATIFFLTPFRIFELGIGALMVWLIQYKPRNSLVLEPLVIIGLSMIGYGVFAFDKTTLFPSYNALLPCLGAALIIYAGSAKYTGRLLNNVIMVCIGLISYSLYLVHWPLFIFYQYYNFGTVTLAQK
jgi:peptidoglycan/LPS O-acetylase OafA/YrhL